MTDRRIIEAIESSDTDDLLRIVDGMAKSRDWGGMVNLRVRCHEAASRGRQLWGVDTHIRYRLALEAPGEWAGPVVAEGPGRFTLGPLAEVAASRKEWSELEPHLPPGPERATVAAERVVRGESGIGPIADLPDSLQPWEPRYSTPTYHSDRIEDSSPDAPPLEPVDVGSSSKTIDDLDSEDALAQLVGPWTDESNGRCQTATVEGGVVDALAGLGLPSARVGSLEPAEALSWMAWAAASGGAHGRRRGAAAGRYGAWWALAAMGDLDWPADPGALGDFCHRVDWVWFDDGAPATGWALRVAAADATTGLAWAVSALDSAD